MRRHWFVAATLSLVCAQVGLFVWFLGQTLIHVPFWDMFDFIDRYLTYRDDGQLAAYLWQPHNEHRLVWTRVLVAADIALFDGGAYGYALFAVAVLVVPCAMLVAELYRGPRPRELKIAAAALVVVLCFTVPNAVDCSVPINAVYPPAVGFSVVALLLFDGRGEGGCWALVRRFSALAAAAAAALGNGVGLAAFPLLFWSAWRGRLGWRWFVIVGVAGAAFGVVYLHGVRSPGVAAPEPASLLKFVDYALTFLGLPWTRLPALAAPGKAIGGLFLLLAGVVLVRCHAAPVTRLQRIAGGLVLFSLLAVAAATVGRADMEADVRVPVRYTLLLWPLHAGLVCFALSCAAQWWDTRRMTCQTFVLAAIALLVVQQVPTGLAAAAASRSITATVTTFLSGVRTNEMEHVVYPDLASASEVVERMRRHNVYRWLVHTRGLAARSAS